MEITIRPTRPEDAKAIAAMRRMPGVFENIMGYPSESDARMENAFAKYDENNHQFVATVQTEDGEKVIGMAGLTVSPRTRSRHVGYVGMAVHGDYQGKGVGTKLMAAVVDMADNWLMLKRTELTVFTDNAPAIALYEKFGFEIEGTLRGMAVRKGEYTDGYTMARLRFDAPEVKSEKRDNGVRHLGTKELHEGEVTLRRFALEDAPTANANWMANANVTKYLTWTPHKDLTETKNTIRTWVNAYRKNDFYQWAIEVGGEVIGSISAFNFNEGAMSVEIGYCIGEAWWGKGITTAALKAVLRFFFEEVGAKRVFAGHASENVRSGSVMKSCGMIYEGTLRGAVVTGEGVICDEMVYGMLVGEYFATNG